MPDMQAWNHKLIEEFRAHDGQVGGMWEGRPLLLLTTTWAQIYPQFGEYQEKTTRVIPVIELEPHGA